MNIKESKENLRALFDDLKKEVDGTITPSGDYLPPSACSYSRKANKLIDEVRKYAELDNNFFINPVLHTLDKEVSYVENYNGGRKTKKKKQEELEDLMRNATKQLYKDLYPLVKE